MCRKTTFCVGLLVYCWQTRVPKIIKIGPLRNEIFMPVEIANRIWLSSFPADSDNSTKVASYCKDSLLNHQINLRLSFREV